MSEPKPTEEASPSPEPYDGPQGEGVQQRPWRDHTSDREIPESMLVKPIGIIRSPYKERYGTPRQSGLQGINVAASEAPAWIEFDRKIVPHDAIADLAGFDRVWLITWLHLNRSTRKARVRTPRGGPPRSIYATRAPHRYNPIGLSSVRVVRVEGSILHIADLDLLDGTPVLDIKPYVAYADAWPEASAGWVDETGGKPKVG